MRYSSCTFLLGLLWLLLPNDNYAVPTASPSAEIIYQLKQNFYVDIHQFSQSLSHYLLFNQVDPILSIMSKNISKHFQNLIHVKFQHQTLDDDFVVDIDLLKGQLQGAVGSFVEDSLPALWNKRLTTIDKISLAQYIEDETTRTCQVLPNYNNYSVDQNTQMVSNQCLVRHADQLIFLIDNHIQNQLKLILKTVVKDDLPKIFETIQTHVNGILDHFNRYLMQHNNRMINSSSGKNAATIIYKNVKESSTNDLLVKSLEKSIQSHFEAFEHQLYFQKLIVYAKTELDQ
ncbi:hypothetical protein BDF20DRAFT_831536 [Mycotypha africana]|uniref:uncharacterized protein n=1 Tax=Mycotypha africana TaxID=64632 RepID=UPI002301B0E3|nr:uncharacterized protein BDF20DRAFT_831536 [Mycotypha africana]KAI8991502.1 hypothetical protein BDF20DRAFT_831536 [Mycotypha africana]